MFLKTRIDSLLKITILVGVASVMLTACGEKSKSTSGKSNGERSAYEVSGDHALGDPRAPITVVEYASVTCPHCATWAKTVWPEFRTKYVDTGKVRYVFREYPTAPLDLATAGHLLANCAPDENFFDMIHVQFKSQRKIMFSNDIKGDYVALAKSVGMNEADFDACMANEKIKQHLNDVIELGSNDGITGTPAFVINGKKKKVYVLESFDKEFAKILGENLPAIKDDTKTLAEPKNH
ncbi:MAG: DsbA family protein [Robiginitomaculum sp.]